MKKNIITIAMLLGILSGANANNKASINNNIIITNSDIEGWFKTNINKINFIKYNYSGSVIIHLKRIDNYLNIAIDCDNLNLSKDIEAMLITKFQIHYLNDDTQISIPLKFIIHE